MATTPALADLPSSPESTGAPAGSPAELVRRAAASRGLKAAELLHRAALLFREHGDLPSAVHSLGKALEHLAEDPDPQARPRRAELEFLLGRVFEEDMGRLDGALLHYQRAFKLNPEVTQPLHRGRAIYRTLGDLGMVGRLFELELDSLPPTDSPERRALSLDFARLRLLQQHDPESAVQILETLLQEVPVEHFSDEILETLAEAYVSPDLRPDGDASLRQAAQRRAGQLFLALGLRHAPGPKAVPGQIDPDRALIFLRRALGADPASAAAASATEQIYLTLPSPAREAELLRLYKTGARVPRRGLKLLALLEAQKSGAELTPDELREAIAACRAGLEEADSLEEWSETKTTLRRLMQQAGDGPGLASLLEEEATEAALPEERVDLLLQAADLYRRAGDNPRFLATLEEAIRTAPQLPEAFRRLCEYHNGRRDFASLAGAHELRLLSLQESEQLDGPTYVHHLEELADIYEKRLQDIAAAAKVWRRIDEFEPTPKSHEHRKRLGQRLSRTERQIAELQMELDHRTPADAMGKRSDLLRKLAQLYREQHDPERAAAMYRELLLFSANDIQSLKALYELREQDNNVPEQIELLVRQVEAAGDRAERLGLLRRVVTLAGSLPDQVDRLIWACKALLSELPSDRDTLRRLAEAQERAGDARSLLDTLETHVKLAPNPREKIPLHKQIAALAESTGDLARATSHLERAARLCPPGPDAEAVLVELARTYGKQGRGNEQIQALELALRQNAKASPETYRALARAAEKAAADSGDKAQEDKALRAYREVASRLPNDLDTLSALSRLHRGRAEWTDLAATLRRSLAIPDQAADSRLNLGLDLAEVLSQRLDDRAAALQVLTQLQADYPHCDRQFHRRLRSLHEDLGDHVAAIRCAERELLLTQDPQSSLELAMQIAGLWRHKVKDPGRALLGYERVLELMPEEAEDAVAAREAQRIVAQAMDAMSELYAEAADWSAVVTLGEHRLQMAQGEPVRAASILLELAVVCEEKLQDPRRGFGLRRRAWELAPEMVPLSNLSQVAAHANLWAELSALHYARLQHFRDLGQPPPLDSLLGAAQIQETRLGEPGAAFKLLRSAIPTGREAPVLVTTPGHDSATVLRELLRLTQAAAESKLPEANTFGRELLGLLHQFIEELCGQRGAAGEEAALRLHRLLGMAAQVREDVLGDVRGALEERLRAFTLGGERDAGSTPAADAVFTETVAEVRRLSLLANQVKEAHGMDQRRLDRADTDLRKQQVALDIAAWVDDATSDPPKALRACLKALTLCEDGSDAQAEIRGRLFTLGGKLGTLAWEEIARTERSLPAATPTAMRRRLRHVATLWEQGAGEFTRAVEACGQAYRLTFFPTSGEPGRSGKATKPPVAEAAPSAQELEQAAAERPGLRAELDRLAGRAPSDSEGPAKVVALLDGLAAQLNESGEAALAASVLLDAARTDERRGRNPHAERRYQEVLKNDPGNAEAFEALEKLYRKQRRPQDLAALLERRRSGSVERMPPGPARRATLLELGELYQQLNKAFEALEVYGGLAAEDDSDPEPHQRMGRVHESQRAFARAAEAYTAQAERARAGAAGPGKPDTVQALRAFLRAGEVWEKQVGSPERALSAYTAAFLMTGGNLAPVTAAPAAPGPDAAPAATPGAVPTHDAGATDARAERQAALAGIERILEKQQRYADLDVLLGQRLGQLALPRTASSSDVTPVLPTIDERAEEVALLRRRIALLRDRLKGTAEARDVALRCAAQLAEILPEDDDVLAQHEALLLEAGEGEAAARTAEQRAAAAGRHGRPAAEQAALFSAAAERYLAADKTEAGEAALRRALALRPDHLDNLRTLAQLRRDAGDLDDHVRTLRELAARDPDGAQAAQVLLEAAELRLTEGHDPAGAEALWQEALQRDATGPMAISALQRLCELRLEAKDLDGARRYAEQELELHERSDLGGSTGQRADLHALLGRLSLQRGAPDEARRQFEAALLVQAGHLQASVELAQLLWQAADYARVEALLREALRQAAAPPDDLDTDTPQAVLSAPERARLLRMQAEACERLGETAACYDALREAEQLLPGGPREHLLLGEAAYRLGHADVAAHYLGGLLSTEEQGGTGLQPRVLADALVHGARAALSQQQREPARHLLTAALERAPGHGEGEAAYLELLLGGGEPDQREAVELLSRRGRQRGAAGDLAGGVRDLSEAAQGAGRLGEAARAQGLLQEALALLGDSGDEALQEQISLVLLDLVFRSGDLPGARAHATRLVGLSRTGLDRAARLQRLAELDQLAGATDEARGHLEQALRALPRDQRAARQETLRRLVPLLDDAGRAALLSGELDGLSGADGAAADEGRVRLWAGLAEAQARLGQTEAAARSYERAISEAAGLPRGLELELRRAALRDLDLAVPESARAHLQVLLREDPADVASLRRVQRLALQGGQAGAAQRLLQVLKVLGDREAGEPGPVGALLAGAALEEADHLAFADPAGRVFSEVMATLFEGVVAVKAPNLDTFGVGPADRAPPVESSADELVRWAAQAFRVLGNRRANLYRGKGGGVRLSAKAPTALIVGVEVAKRPAAEALFLLGRQIELLRAEYILAEALLPAAFTELLGLAVRAFHPRHARTAGDDVAAWRRELPYKTVKRLSDLLKEQADVQFSSAMWRRGVYRTANRAGLLVCGDLAAAEAVLRGLEGPDGKARAADEIAADVRDLVEFWQGPTAALADRLRG